MHDLVLLQLMHPNRVSAPFRIRKQAHSIMEEGDSSALLLNNLLPLENVGSHILPNRLSFNVSCLHKLSEMLAHVPNLLKA